MKKTIYTTVALIALASCSNEATNEHITFFGASFGMEKREALDSLFAHCIIAPDSICTDFLLGLEDRYAYHYSEAANFGNITIPTRFYFTSDTLIGILGFLQFTKYDREDSDIQQVYEWIADSSSLLAPYKMQRAEDGSYYSKVTYKGEPLARLDTIVDVEEYIYNDNDTTIYIVIGIGCEPIRDVPLIMPTDAQLTVGNGSKIKLGDNENDVKRLLWKEKGASIFGESMIMMYDDDIVEGMKWKYATYTFMSDRLDMVSLLGYSRTKAEATEMMHSIASASRFQKKYNFTPSVKNGEPIYESTLQTFHDGYTQYDDDYELAGGRYMPLVTLSVEKDTRGSSYHVEINYNY